MWFKEARHIRARGDYSTGIEREQVSVVVLLHTLQATGISDSGKLI
jgi:hypothetical protein